MMISIVPNGCDDEHIEIKESCVSIALQLEFGASSAGVIALSSLKLDLTRFKLKPHAQRFLMAPRRRVWN